jgi:hypothetical protein
MQADVLLERRRTCRVALPICPQERRVMSLAGWQGSGLIDAAGGSDTGTEQGGNGEAEPGEPGRPAGPPPVEEASTSSSGGGGGGGGGVAGERATVTGALACLRPMGVP